MSFVGPVNLLSHRGNYCSIFSIKDISVSHAKQKNILQELVLMSTFNELSQWVESTTSGQRYIASPSHTSHEDRNSCLNCLQELLLQAIQGRNIRRKDGRDLKLVKASKNGDYYTIASILASAAWSYWKTYFLFNSGDTAFYAKNQQKNKEKNELQRAQIEHIGAAVSFQKAHKNGAFQEIFDFFETEEIVRLNND